MDLLDTALGGLFVASFLAVAVAFVVPFVAIVADEERGRDLAARLTREVGMQRCEIIVARPRNRGATVVT